MMSFLWQIVLPEWLMTPLVMALGVLPGLGFAALAARRVRLSWPETIATSFAFSVAITSAFATCAYLLRLPLNVVLAAYLAAIPVSLWFFMREYRNGHLKRPPLEKAGLVAAGIAALVAMIERPWFRSGTDGFYHMAATRSLLAFERPLVTDPFHGTHTNVLDPTSGVWHTIQAIMSRTLFTDISTLYLGITALGAGMAVLGFWVLARRVGGSQKVASIATVAMVAVAYHFDLRSMAHPRHISEAVAFFGIALLVRLLDEPEWPVAVLAGVVGAAAVTMHLGTGEFLFLCGGFMLLALVASRAWSFYETRETSWSHESLAVPGALGIAAVLSIPVLLPRVGTLSGALVLGPNAFVDLPSQLVHVFGVDLVKPGGIFTGGPLVFFAVLVLIALAWPSAFRDRDAHALATVGMLSMMPLLLTDPVVTPFALKHASYMLARLAVLMRFLPFVGIAWALGAAVPRREKLVHGFAVFAIALAVLGAAPDLYYTLFQDKMPPVETRGLDVLPLAWTYEMDVRASWGPDTLKQMREIFGDKYPRVAADPYASYYLAALEPVSVVQTPLGHSPASVGIHDGEVRRGNMGVFFRRTTGEEMRRYMINRYHIKYVLVWKIRQHGMVASFLAQPNTFKLVMISDKIDLFQVISPEPVKAKS